ncbi:MAG: hypothetical protein IIY78_09780, partial [Clostridia bacterium]|nr:hypothetical protein [Clostridia bacterium]
SKCDVFVTPDNIDSDKSGGIPLTEPAHKEIEIKESVAGMRPQAVPSGCIVNDSLRRTTNFLPERLEFRYNNCNYSAINEQKSKNAQTFLVLLLPSRLRRATVPNGWEPSPTAGSRPRRQRLPPAGETLSSAARLRELYKMTNNSKFAHL